MRRRKRHPGTASRSEEPSHTPNWRGDRYKNDDNGSREDEDKRQDHSGGSASRSGEEEGDRGNFDGAMGY